MCVCVCESIDATGLLFVLSPPPFITPTHTHPHTNFQAQKFSVRTSLERGFRRYITRVADFDALLMAELQKLMKDTLAYNMMRRLRSDDEEPTCVLVCICVVHGPPSHVLS